MSSQTFVIESKFETPPIMEVEALLLAHESRTNRFQKKIFSSVNTLKHMLRIQDRKFTPITFVETLVVPPLIEVVAIVVVQVVVVGLLIFSAKSVSNMVILPTFVFTMEILPINHMNL